VAGSQPTSCVQRKGQPPECLPPTCATAPRCWFHYCSTVFHWQPLPTFVGQNVFTTFSRSPKGRPTLLTDHFQLTQETVEPCQFSPAELVD
jgi:hypothetical protein